MTAARSQRVAVLGMGRSGTTVVTELLGASGIYLDEVNWAFEHENARAVNDKYLEEHYGARQGIPYGKLPKDEIEVDEPDWRGRAASFVAAVDERAAGRTWAFKDPRTTILWDMWSEHMDVVVAVVRRPELVVESYMRQGWIKGFRPRHKTLAYWRRFNESLLRILDAGGPQRMFTIEMSNDVLTQLDAINEQLGLRLSDEARSTFEPERQPPPGAHDIAGADRALYERLLAHRTVPA